MEGEEARRTESLSWGAPTFECCVLSEGMDACRWADTHMTSQFSARAPARAGWGVGYCRRTYQPRARRSGTCLSDS